MPKMPEIAEKVFFPAPENARIPQFKAPDFSKEALYDFRGLISSKRCDFRSRNRLKIGNIRPLITPKRLGMISGA